MYIVFILGSSVLGEIKLASEGEGAYLFYPTKGSRYGADTLRRISEFCTKLSPDDNPYEELTAADLPRLAREQQEDLRTLQEELRARSKQTE